MGLNPRSDRGKTRQFAAQIAMLFLSHREHGSSYIPDINAGGINTFYFSHIDFDQAAASAKRLVAILDKLTELLSGRKRPKLKAHDAIHLVLLTDALWDDYTRSWEQTLPDAVDKFSEALASAKANKDAATPDEFWNRYGQWTRVNSDRGERIAHRHSFYMEKMFEFLGPLQAKDSQRAFGVLEREIIYFRSNKKCAVCGAAVSWNEAEIHHVVEHSAGGKTNLDNAALVYSACHPKGEKQTQEFAERFIAMKQSAATSAKRPVKDDTTGYLWKHGNSGLFLPHETALRMQYRGNDFFARVNGDEIIYKDMATTLGE
jgi:HNH endonuclease